LLRGVQAIGALAGGLVLAASRRLPAGRLTACGALALGLVSLAVWNAPRVTTSGSLYLALFIAAGFPGIALVTGLLTWLQETTPDGQRGRAFAGLGAVSAVGQALGALAGGILGDRLSVVTVLNGQAAVYLLAGVLALVCLRPPARAGRPNSIPAPRQASRAVSSCISRPARSAP
jgi:MFS family permease